MLAAFDCARVSPCDQLAWVLSKPTITTTTTTTNPIHWRERGQQTRPNQVTSMTLPRHRWFRSSGSLDEITGHPPKTGWYNVALRVPAGVSTY